MTERELFEAALELPPGNRVAYLDGVCGSDGALRQRLEALLSKHDRAGSFLEEPAASAFATVEEPAVSERPGTLIGPYKLLEQLGEGGFGVVFLAEQQEPLRRKVALKVLKPGMDTRQVVARFEAERQALALMDHPHIARVFDGGATASGRPYFVMELVKGVPITQFCDDHRLTPRQRLELFVSVCQAIQHAHQKGIIHRDLKPSNVLVASHDGTPVVKVIDFGVAKAIGQQLTEKTVYTGLGQMIGTPLYMSPEQAALSGLDVDTRSDIYSLGVLLYELLTGTTPFERERFKEVGYDEMRRIIREEEPPKPSTRLSTTEELPSIAARRKTEPAQLGRLVQGDLDWIVMKALEKDRSRRYETASAFAADVQRYLKDEPVHACPPSATYRLRKFLRRNKGPVLAASLVALALVGGIVGAFWGLIRATDAQAVAVAESGKKDVALQERKQAIDRLGEEKRQAQINYSTALLDKGLESCEKGDVGLGMAWLARSLENAPEDAADLQRVLRVNLAAWHRQLSPLRAVLPHQGPVRRVAFGPDGKTALTVSAIGNDWLRGEVRRWDAVTGEELGRPIPHQGFFISLVAFSPDGKMVLTGSDPKTAQLWDLETGQPRGAPLPLAHGLNRTDDSVIFSADGRRLLIADGNEVQVWETATGKPVGKPLERGECPSPVALSPDGQTVLTVNGTTAQLWKAGTWEQLGEPLPQQSDIRVATFSPDSELVVTAGASVRVWEVATGKLMGKPLTPPQESDGVAFTPDMGMVVTWSRGAVTMWWVGSTGNRWRVPAERAADLGVGSVPFPVSGGAGVAFSPDGQTILTSSPDGTVRLCDLRTVQPIGAPLQHPRARAFADPLRAAFSPDGRTIVTGSEDGARLWDAATRREPCGEWKMPGKRLSPIVNFEDTTAISPDGKMALTVTHGDKHVARVVQLWEVATPKPLGQPLQFEAISFAMGFSPDGEAALLSASPFPQPPGNQLLWLWKAGTWTSTVLPGPPQNVVALGPGGRTALLGDSTGIARLWEVASWKAVGPPLPHQARVVALSPDGRIALTGGGLEARLWEAATGKPLGPPLAHQGPIQVAVFSPDGRTVLTGGEDNTARLWDVATGQQIGAALLHPGIVKALAFSPDGRTLVTASVTLERRDRGTIHFWDVATGKPLGPPFGPATVTSVMFAPDGRTALVGAYHTVWALETPAAPLEGSVQRLVLWAQLSTSKDLDAAGVAGWQTAATWQQRRRSLLELEKK